MAIEFVRSNIDHAQTTYYAAKLIWGIVRDFGSYPTELETESSLVDLKTEDVVALKTILHFYREAAGVGREDFAKSGAYEAFAVFYKLVRRYDDTLDTNREKDPVPATVFVNDDTNIALLNRGIELVHAAPASTKQKEQFLSDFGEFCLTEYELYAIYMQLDGGNTGFDKVKTYKDKTCGLNALMIAKLLRLYCPGIDDKAAKDAEDFIQAGMMFAQVYDDVGDFRIDQATNTANYFLAALGNFPEEKAAVETATGKLDKLKLKQLCKLAPQSLALCDQIATEYLLQIPDRLRHYRQAIQPSRTFLSAIKNPEVNYSDQVNV
jgi:hypothetical protein